MTTCPHCGKPLDEKPATTMAPPYLHAGAANPETTWSVQFNNNAAAPAPALTWRTFTV